MRTLHSCSGLVGEQDGLICRAVDFQLSSDHEIDRLGYDTEHPWKYSPRKSEIAVWNTQYVRTACYNILLLIFKSLLVDISVMMPVETAQA